MDKKLEKKLVEKYPTLYSKYGGDIKETCMGWGMTCGDGWYKLLDELSSKLEPLNVVAAQVKEKFGGLRFYLEPCDENVYDKVNEIIDEAEQRSYKVCEICGKEGQLRRGGWLQTTCDICQALCEEGKSPVRDPEAFGLPLTE